MDLANFTPASTERSNYKFWRDEHVRYNDLDMLGHVTSARVNEYFAGVRTALFQQLIPNWPKAAVVPVLKIAVIDYLREITYPQQLEVGLGVERIGTKSLQLGLAIFHNEACLNLSRNVFVFFNTATRKAEVPSREIVEGFMNFKC